MNKGIKNNSVVIVALILAIFSIYYSEFTKFQGILMYALLAIDFVFIISLLLSLRPKEVSGHHLPFSLAVIAMYMGRAVVFNLFLIVLDLFTNNISSVGATGIAITSVILFLFVLVLLYPKFFKLTKILSIVYFLIFTLQNFGLAYGNTVLGTMDASSFMSGFATIWSLVLSQVDAGIIGMLAIICLIKMPQIQQ